MVAVVVAVIAAVGTVVVALIGVINIRLPLKDTRAQLLKDAKLVSKLDEDSLARRLLQRYLDVRVGDLIHDEAARPVQKLVWEMYWIGVTLTVLAGALYIGGASPEHRAEMLRGSTPIAVSLLITGAVVNFAAYFMLWKTRSMTKRRLDFYLRTAARQGAAAAGTADGLPDAGGNDDRDPSGAM